MKPTSRRVQAALEKDATLKLARFERLESWNGLAPGDSVRIAGHRGGSWKFRAHVTNTSNGASWIEVSEVLAAGRRTPTFGGGDPDSELPARTSMTRTRSFRPGFVTPLKRSRANRPRRKPSLPRVQAPVEPGVQGTLFDQAADDDKAADEPAT